MEIFRVKEIRQGNIQAVTELFQSNNSGILTFPIHNAFDRRLGDSRTITQPIASEFTFLA